MRLNYLVILQHVALISIILAAGVFGFNQYINYLYDAEKLLTPCELCQKLNPQVPESCFLVMVKNETFAYEAPLENGTIIKIKQNLTSLPTNLFSRP